MSPGHGPDADSSFIAEALPAFISEAHEQLQALEQLLLQLEDAPGDAELLNALFRCAHTVKGSAGIFGLDRVVAFAHHVESLLDRLREGEVALTPPLGTLLLQCNDQIRALVAEAGAPAADDPAGDTARAALVQRLQAAGAAGAPPSAVARAAGPDTDAAATAGSAPGAAGTPDGAGRRRWHIAVAFGPATFRNGMDPLAILNYLRGMGEIHALVLDVDGVPPLQRLDPETCALTFEFALDTAATRAEIESAFSFVREDCRLHIVEPGARPEDFVALIDALPDNPRLGEILIAAGAISRVQLQQALDAQHQASAAGLAPAPLGTVLQATAGVSPQVVDAALAKQERQRASAPATGAGGGAPEEPRYIRVQADRLDAVINLLGELVIAGAGASLLARQTRQGALVEATAQIGRLIEDIRNGTLQLRMVPIGETFARFRRVVRDTAAELGKEVALELVGGETELDKSVVERIADPLMHLVRNALDHGLEGPAQRQAAGKPATGRLQLSACHDSGSILIRITDDGRGIQRQKVLERAWDRGLVERGTVPPDAEIDRLIFAPGFSTAEQVTSLSGRGVGMDVVKRNIEALRGTVTLHSAPGAGATVEIRLPLTLAIIDGFLVGVGASRFIFPLESVVEVIEHRTPQAPVDGCGRSVVQLRGAALPVADLRTLYGLEGPAPERSSVVVLQSGERRYGVRVDTLLGQHQTVIKPLGRMFRSLRGMSGSSILGNGDVALIFDVHALAALAADPPARVGAEAPHWRRLPPPAPPQQSAQHPQPEAVSARLQAAKDTQP